MRKLISLFVSALFAVGAWAEEPLSGEYVDLGLSVKWATCNLGATSSTDAGWYLAWGETSPKTNYTWETYLSALGGTMTQSEDAGTEKDPLKEYVKGGANYSKGIGATDYDAATVALGAGYRMPTLEEFAELANTDNCEWVWYDKGNTEFNGVAGYKVTSKKTGYTGNSIFLPAAGYRNGGRLSGEGSGGGYWSSTPDPDTAVGAYGLYFDSGAVSPNDGYGRSGGIPVRPVYDGPDPIAQITIGETTTKYYDLERFESGFYNIEGKANVKLLGDIVFSDYDMIFNEIGANITLDLNGHSIKGANAYLAFIEAKLTITGEGAMESTNDVGLIFNSYGSIVVNDGTYKAVGAICNVTEGKELIINGGKFKAPALYFKENEWIKPIVKGGLFSMNPSDCVAEGYETVANDDEATKAEYPYKVVEKAPIAQITIGETTTKYTDVEEFIEAFYAIRDEATVKLLGDITLPARAKIESPNGYAIISLDLNGHNIKGNIDDGIINVSVSSLTIGGEGIVENIRAGGTVIGVSYNTFLVVNGGSYASVSEVCYVRDGCELTINAGKFKAPALYFKANGWIKPIVKGGIFSMDPSDCVADGYEAVENDDEDTKADYPYKVVEKPLTPTAIDAVNADNAGKVTKTIENGKVVIIRGDKKYDLSGREL